MALKLVSLLGIVTMIAAAWLISSNRRAFPWRTVLWGLGLQWIFALLILKTEVGRSVFGVAHRAVTRLIGFANEGAAMVFGPLANQDVLAGSWGPGNAFILAVTVVSTIILVSAISSLLYHWRILPQVVRLMAIIMQRLMRTSGSESLAAAANVFMGHTEAPLLVRPYLARMTRSELAAMMTSGMATIAGGVLAVYVAFGAEAGHLITASVLSAPAALVIAKIMLPETEISETRAGTTPAPVERTAANSIDALCRGASEGLWLSLNVLAMLITFVALVALLNFLLALGLRPFGAQLTLQQIFGWANAPFAWLMGVPLQDCLLVGQVLGERIVLNELFGYLTLTQNRELLDPRSFTLATYALCGFANFGSIAIQIGGVGNLAPERRRDFAELGLRSMVGGILACYLTACLVGVLV